MLCLHVCCTAMTMYSHSLQANMYKTRPAPRMAGNIRDTQLPHFNTPLSTSHQSQEQHWPEVGSSQPDYFPLHLLGIRYDVPEPCHLPHPAGVSWQWVIECIKYLVQLETALGTRTHTTCMPVYGHILDCNTQSTQNLAPGLLYTRHTQHCIEPCTDSSPFT